MNGRISKRLTIWCGICGDWDDLEEHTRALAAKEARKKGWKLTVQSGWICPDCGKKKVNT